ncbi:hypothetical protein GCM10022239_09380 [Leifsonia bigeumensis]|uniref:O-antigen/teichoic acid export membrane protein n=1 Tax=Leifsonella bigeumensis TaxID=433643 RepID=A0ABP7FGL9_9MICO
MPLVISAGSGALYSALTPLVALLLLKPADYGLFSIVYLIYAFGISLQYSVISEAWARARLVGSRTATWSEYSTSLLGLGFLVGLASLITALLIPSLLPTSAFLGAASLLAVYQNGSRYYRVAEETYQRVIASDLAGLALFAAGFLATSGLSPLQRVSIAWSMGALAAVVVLGLPYVRRASGLHLWVRSHRSAIGPLLTDSLLMDAGAIGTPFLLAGLLGPARFGVYRAVSNVALPVRLLVEPMRPAIGRSGRSVLFSAKGLLTVGGAALGMSLAAYFALVWVVPALPFPVGTLAALVPYSAAAAVFVAGNVLGSVYYILCRTNSTHGQILTGRFLQTGLVIVFPIVGFLIQGLAGAIWGFSVSAGISAIAWMVIAFVSRQRGRGGGEPSG